MSALTTVNFSTPHRMSQSRRNIAREFSSDAAQKDRRYAFALLQNACCPNAEGLSIDLCRWTECALKGDDIERSLS